MVDYISKIIFGKGLDKNDGSCDNLSQPASQLSITLPFFLSSSNCKFSRRILPV